MTPVLSSFSSRRTSRTSRSAKSPPPKPPATYIDLTGPEPTVRPWNTTEPGPRPVFEDPLDSLSTASSTPCSATAPPKLKGRKALTVKDAMLYMEMVKRTYSDRDPTAYDQFLGIMQKFKAQSLDTEGVMRRVMSLFEGEPMLLKGFDIFLPEGFTMPTSRPQAPSDTDHLATKLAATSISATADETPLPWAPFVSLAEEELQYIARVKAETGPDVYAQFLKALQDFSDRTRDMNSLMKRLSSLFGSHPALLDDFNTFLPAGYRIDTSRLSDTVVRGPGKGN